MPNKRAKRRKQDRREKNNDLSKYGRTASQIKKRKIRDELRKAKHLEGGEFSNTWKNIIILNYRLSTSVEYVVKTLNWILLQERRIHHSSVTYIG